MQVGRWNKKSKLIGCGDAVNKAGLMRLYRETKKKNRRKVTSPRQNITFLNMLDLCRVCMSKGGHRKPLEGGGSLKKRTTLNVIG